MKHAFNLKKIAELAKTENSPKSLGNFYNRLTMLFQGAYGQMNEKEIAQVRNTMRNEWKRADEHLNSMARAHREAKKAERSKTAA